MLIRAFGRSPKLRILDFFLDNKLFDFSKKEIIEEVGLSKTTFYKYWDELESLGILEVSRKFGKTRLYRLDRTNPITKILMKLELFLIEKNANEIGEEIQTKPRVPIRV